MITRRHTQEQERVANAYRGAARYYDALVNAFGLMGLYGFRRQAVRALALKPGDTVVDIGCGSGANFALLEEAVGAEGKIIGVDLTDAMLNLARQRIIKHRWNNITLVEADAGQFVFPTQVDGVLATFSLVLVPDCKQVILNGCAALKPGSKFAVLDMSWPRWLPLWWWRALFFLRGLGVNRAVLERRNWESIWQTLQTSLTEARRKHYWLGMYYLAVGTRQNA